MNVQLKKGFERVTIEANGNLIRAVLEKEGTSRKKPTDYPNKPIAKVIELWEKKGFEMDANLHHVGSNFVWF